MLTDLNIHPKAKAILSCLDALHGGVMGDESFLEKCMKYPMALRSAAYYNGRERGICLYGYCSSGMKKGFVIAFAECRNSDEIVIDYWEIDGPCFLNPPTVADFTDEAYSKRERLRYSQIEKAVYIIHNHLDKIATSFGEELATSDTV
jgi:hypothetical protein